MQVSSFLIGPHKTPKTVKVFLWITALLSLLSPIVTFAMAHYFRSPGPQHWLALSRWGLEEGWVWQPLTYFFIQSAGVGITVSLLISLFFQLFLLWFSGSEIAFRFGPKQFVLFYLGGGVIAGCIAASLLFLFSSNTAVVGSGPPIYALLMVWAMLYPDLKLYFFFLFRIKAKWLIAAFLGIALLMNLSYGQLIPFVADLAGILWGFLIGRFVWKLPNPYPLNLELPKRGKRGGRGGEEKIIDIEVFQESDAAFMDRMLDKVAREGESSLTPRERARMNKISKGSSD